MTEKERYWLWFIALTALEMSLLLGFLFITHSRELEKLSKVVHNNMRYPSILSLDKN